MVSPSRGLQRKLLAVKKGFPTRAQRIFDGVQAQQAKEQQFTSSANMVGWLGIESQRERRVEGSWNRTQQQERVTQQPPATPATTKYNQPRLPPSRSLSSSSSSFSSTTTLQSFIHHTPSQSLPSSIVSASSAIEDQGVLPSTSSPLLRSLTRVKLSGTASRAGREDTRFEGPLPDPRVYGKEEVDTHFAKSEYRPVRTHSREEFQVYEERSAPRDRYPEVDLARERYYDSHTQDKKGFETQLDITEHEYRRRTDPSYAVQYDSGRSYSTQSRDIDVSYDRVTDNVETYKPRTQVREIEYDSNSSRFDKHIEVETERRPVYDTPKQRMGYYDDEGQYHSFRRGVERAADRILHPFHHHHHKEEVMASDERGPARVREGVRESVRVVQPRGGHPPGTITIPCHFIRIGDLLILQGRPCQVIRISVSSQTGQHRYLGVDLFTGQLHEESSFVSNPSPSVVVQSMLGPVYKTYRILDLREDGRLTAMTETGDIKQGIRVIDQGGLFNRISDAFADGKGSVRALVINDGGRELVVDYKVIHGSRL
ncbi:woronin body major protein [Uncinocarpus reesii 1704]|uniref:Woronin body major protein n=1 Tax=Uncinocarpus reesii (strain UAMH 1704) TaxID=336963 RepID=C4JLL4_UNCRE|nr:woronin body major protein [Uncinocarpus reesii 1704]EEP78876.1 woronin body major protein [Uncinocarpus reesii 1704]